MASKTAVAIVAAAMAGVAGAGAFYWFQRGDLGLRATVCAPGEAASHLADASGAAWASTDAP